MSRSIRAVVVVIGLLCTVRAGLANDWPTFRHDNSRSGYTPELFDAKSVEEAWVYGSPHPPQPAWPGPARWDSYANIRGLGSMRNYDPCFHPVIVGNRLFFGSSTDDSVRAVDVITGELLWTFTTDGPVRIAPTVAGQNVYFGSDDGCAYCVTADDGKLVWKSNRVDDTKLILNNGRFVSLSPCRTGVLVDGDVAYFAQGMLPWRNTVLYAVDRLTGRTDGPEQFATAHFGLTLEGALLASDSHVVAPAGRVAPEVFRQTDGQHEGPVDGSGGSGVVLTDDGHILCGPGNKTGWITESDIHSRKQINVHGGAVATAVMPDGRVLVSRTRLSAYDSSGKTKRWDVPCQHHNEVIVAGNTIFVGGDDVVAAYGLDSGDLLWETPVDGAAFGLAVANGQLFVSTDTGTIHCFRTSDESPAALLAAADDRGTGPSTNERSQFSSENPLQEREEDSRSLLGHWVVHREMSASARRRGASDGDRRVSDLTGNAHARISGAIQLREVGGVEALELDGETNTLLITDNIKEAPLPRKSLSVETWVRVDEADSAGGIIGCMQDSKQEKSGWMLGFHHSRFVFGLAAEGGTEGISFLRGKTPVRPGHWYHVVARYNGEVARLSVNGVDEAVDDHQQGAITYPATGFYEMGASHDADSFHPMYGMLHEVRVYDRNVTDEEISRRYEAKRDKFNIPVELPTGPYAQFVAADSARIRWQTVSPVPTRLVLLEGNQTRRFDNSQPTVSHDVIVDRLPRDRMLHYLIEKESEGWNSHSLEFELDTHFNFSVAATTTASPFPDDQQSERFAAAARHILGKCRFEQGVCLVIGHGDGRLAWELARQSKLRVIGVETDRGNVNAARTALLQAGLYGTRVTLHHVESYDDLPFVGRFANLVVSERQLHDGELNIDAKELFRVLRPHGGLVFLGQLAGSDHAFDANRAQSFLAMTGLEPQTETADNGTWVTAIRPPLEGAGEWSHLYGRADNSAFGGEELGGASTTSEMDVQWIGRPGPRAQPDRNGRKPSPLSTGGRLFVQGLHRIIALDGFNGTVLWALEIPGLERFNMPRDCSNWCADDEHVFIAAKDKCWEIDAATGDVLAFHEVPSASRDEWSWDWGYIAQVGDQIIGSAEKAGTAFTSFWGDAGAGWYDARSGPATFKVCSDSLFAVDKGDGNVAWTYEDGVIINSTITVANGRLCFVECRHDKVKQAQARRIGSKELWEQQFLVALNLETGDKIWEQPLDTADGTVAFYLAAGDDALVINASTNKQFEVSTYAVADGEAIWTQTFDWFEKKGDHGKAIQRPAIVGDRVYVRPKIMELATGNILPLEMPKGKCGTYAATTQSLIFRTTQITMWNTASGSASSWDRMRPGCWLSTIPAAGMLLSPEGGGGCSCGSWMEMSVGFMPKESDN
ncbi:MAG: PQQ-binding-like beta-propeller repeat protein [Planctomycetaceae bacterium]